MAECLACGYNGFRVDLAWRSGSAMECHATARSSNPDLNDVRDSKCGCRL